MSTTRIRTARPGYHDDALCVRPENLAGVTEVAVLLDQRPTTVCNWVTRHSYGVPQPVATIAASRLFDLEQWRAWGRSALESALTAHLVGPASVLRKGPGHVIG